MKKITRVWIAALAAGGIAAAASAQEVMSVQVKEAALRSTPSFLGAVSAKAAYGDRVTVVEKRQPWVRVQAGSSGGWVHESALTPKRVVLKAGAGDVQSGAASDELALAGKGFNSDVEEQFKSRNRKADFTAVERMERRVVSQAEMVSFAKDGGIAR